jgi:tetratricopeptide (TPR) repeat protein
MKSETRYILALLLFCYSANSTFSQPSVSELPQTITQQKGVITGPGIPESTSDKFNKGVISFTSGNYKEALQLWTEIYNTGYRSSNLDFNIGNANFKLNNIPAAILFYERAYLLNPTDEDINYNLQIARTLIVDRFQEIPELFFIKWYNFVSLILSTNTWSRISLISFIIFILALSLYIYSLNYRYKVLGFWLAFSFVVLSLTSYTLSSRNKILVYDSHKAIISSPLVNGKSSPDKSGTDLFVLHEGTKVSIEDEVGEWLEIRLTDGNIGWVPLNSLNII